MLWFVLLWFVVYLLVFDDVMCYELVYCVVVVFDYYLIYCFEWLVVW